MDRTEVETVARAIRDWIHETPLSKCNMGSDLCDDWPLAREVASRVEAALDAVRSPQDGLQSAIDELADAYRGRSPQGQVRVGSETVDVATRTEASKSERNVLIDFAAYLKVPASWESTVDAFLEQYDEYIVDTRCPSSERRDEEGVHDLAEHWCLRGKEMRPCVACVQNARALLNSCEEADDGQD